jgi:hypothetical protein
VLPARLREVRVVFTLSAMDKLLVPSVEESNGPFLPMLLPGVSEN